MVLDLGLQKELIVFQMEFGSELTASGIGQ